MASAPTEDGLQATRGLLAYAHHTRGERLCFGDFVAGEDMQEPDGPNKIQKKKIWEKVSEDLKTDADGGAAWGDLPMVSSAGQVTSATLKNANIS